MSTKRDAWRRQKNSALKRGIGFEFAFEAWCAWWEFHLGQDWFQLRGMHNDQYVMARNGDQGPYAAWNVRCATTAENHAEYNFNRKPAKRTRPPRINPIIVKQIFLSKEKHRDIAKKYGVNKHRVHCIKTRRYYRKITDDLTETGRDLDVISATPRPAVTK